MKFKNHIEAQAGFKDAGGATGEPGQILSSTGNTTDWIDQTALSVGSAESTESVHIYVKNKSGAQILKGTPVYVTGETGNSGKIEVAPADASDSAKMPALGLLESTLNNNGEGFCVQGGLLEGLATATIDNTPTAANDTVYVKSGGGLTMTKPTGTGLIQNIAKVARPHASNGSLVVSSILRTNDVPNLPEGRIWVGDGNTIVSDTVYVDEPNNRVGIGTASPLEKLDVNGNILATGKLILNNTDTNASIFMNSSSTGFGGNYIQARKSDGSEQWLIGGNSGSDNRVTLFQANSADIKIRIVGSEVVTIKPNGNFGIGRTSPGAKLDVEGRIISRNDVYISSASPRIWLNDTNNNSDYSIINSNGTLLINDDTNSADRFAITSAGNVGIGMTNPNAKLSVKSSGTNTWVVRATASDGGDLGGIYEDGGTNAELYLKNNAGTSSVLINSSGSSYLNGGDVGIGTTSPYGKLDVAGNIRLQSTNQIYFGGTGAVPYWNVGVDNTTNNNFVIDGVDYYSGDRDILLNPVNNGNVGIGATSPFAKLAVESPYFSSGVCADFKFTGSQSNFYGNTVVKVEIPQYGEGIRITSPTVSPYDDGAMNFFQQTSRVGSININSSSTSYNTTSDYRLKDNKEEILDAIERVKELKPAKFNWIKEPKGKKVDGFYAHELKEVVPEAVTGEKDELYYDGKPKYQSVDQSKVVPLLAAALQQAIYKIEELESRIQILENK